MSMLCSWECLRPRHVSAQSVVLSGADAPSRAKGPFVLSPNHQAEGLCLLPEENELLRRNGFARAFCCLKKAAPIWEVVSSCQSKPSKSNQQKFPRAFAADTYGAAHVCLLGTCNPRSQEGVTKRVFFLRMSVGIAQSLTNLSPRLHAAYIGNRYDVMKGGM